MLAFVLLLLATHAFAAEEPTAAPAVLDEALARRLVEEVTAEVEEMRGLEFARPVPVKVIGDLEAKQRMLERVRRFGYDERMRVHGVAYALLGLVPPRTDLLELLFEALEEQAGGFYEPEDGTFYVMADIPPQAARVVIVHELTHALEDQHYDLDQRLRADLDNEDRLFAASAVHEGSATLLMMAYAARAVVSGKLTASELQAMMENEATRGEVFGRLPAVLQRQLLGPYMLGASFLAQGNLLGSLQQLPLERLAQAYREGPVSSEQILHPARFWDERDDPRAVSLDGAGAVRDRGFGLAGAGTLGELILGTLVGAPTPSLEQATAMTEASAWTNAAAEGWGGDRWELWRRGDEHLLLLMTVWDTPADAQQFAAALPPRLAFERRDERVAVVAGSGGPKPARLLRRMLK